MSGWIQATMQQNTILNLHTYTINVLFCQKWSVESHAVLASMGAFQGLSHLSLDTSVSVHCPLSLGLTIVRQSKILSLS